MNDEESRNTAVFNETIKYYSDKLSKEEMGHLIVNKCTVIDIISGINHVLGSNVRDGSNQSLHIALLFFLNGVEYSMREVLGDDANEVLRIDRKLAEVIFSLDRKMDEMNEYDVID